MTQPAPASTSPATDGVMVSMEEVLAELSERGQLEWELAAGTATRKKLVAANAELRRELAAQINEQSGAKSDG